MPYGLINVDSVVNSDGTVTGGLYGFKNRIINGAMVIDQRNAGGSVNIGGVWPVDRWRTFKQSTATITGQRSATAPAGFINSLLFTTTSAASPASGNEDDFWQVIEGYNVADLAWGTANAQTVTVSFWVKVNNTGTYSGAVGNLAGNRSYPFSFTVSTTNWEQKTITIPGDQSGTWATDNTGGIYLYFNLNSGSTLLGTANAWVGSYKIGVTGSTNIGSIASATFAITGVQFEKGSTATSFDYRPYGTELMLCQRYYYKVLPGAIDKVFNSGYAGSATSARLVSYFPVTMRTAPAALEQTGTASDYSVYIAAGEVNCSSVPTYSSFTTADLAYVNFTASGMTGGDGVVGITNSTTAYLAWSAEL